MATITGLTAERMLEIEAASVVDGDVSGNDLILTRQDGSIINAGDVRGPQGPEGPMGSALEVVSGLVVADVGVANQIKAGRQLAPSDFTAMGLSVPVGLWNLSNANDSSGNTRHLTIKGAVPFGVGINGLASTAAQFAGSTAQALYIVDTGASDPFRIKTGSIGCWVRTAKRGVEQWLVSKFAPTGNQRAFGFYINTSNNIQWLSYADGASGAITAGISDICDDCWHFVVATHDGSYARLYVDGVLEARSTQGHAIFGSTAPFNIGAGTADGSAAAVSPHYGRIDEAFVSGEVLSEEQVRNLYCASIPHALGAIPRTISLSVRRKRRGAPVTAADFPAQPARLYNFDNGAFTDAGANNVPMSLGGPTLVAVGGPDGRKTSAANMPGTAGYYMSASDAGLPGGLSARSFGGWLNMRTISTMAPIGMGSSGANHRWYHYSGGIQFENGSDNIAGPLLPLGEWHHVVEVCDPAPSDGLKRKVYINGRLIGASTVLNSLSLVGANGIHLGSDQDGNNVFNGLLDDWFVYAGVLTAEQVRALYNKSSQALAPSPKAVGDHIEAIELGRLLGIFQSIEPVDLVDLAVMS